jgi:hypothetical protein
LKSRVQVHPSPDVRQDIRYNEPKLVMSRSLVLVAMLFAGVLAAGCSSAPYNRRSVDLNVQLADTINRNMPVAVEVVYAYDPALTDTLSALSASQWFQRRSKLAWRHPDGFDWWRWEWTPDQSVSSQHLPMVFFTRSVFVYAGYRSPGTHRAQVPPFQALDLQLNRTGFQVRTVR